MAEALTKGYDVVERNLAHLLPVGWETQCEEAVTKYGRHIVDPAENRDVIVVAGDAIRAYVTWLFQLFRSPAMINIVTQAVGVYVKPSIAPLSCINISVITGQGKGYPLHFDVQPFSVVLLGTEITPETGGALLMEYGPGDEDVQRVYGEAGHAVVFDGSRVRHGVGDLRRQMARLAIVMHYAPASAQEDVRALDGVLFPAAEQGEATPWVANELRDELPDPTEIGAEFRKVATVWAVQMERSFSVLTADGNLATGQAGDYLCKGPEGEQWPVRQELFEAQYEPVSGTRKDRGAKKGRQGPPPVIGSPPVIGGRNGDPPPISDPPIIDPPERGSA